MDFEPLSKERSDRLRETFIRRFIDTECDYYRRYKALIGGADDSVVCAGFLWDCLRDYSPNRDRCTDVQAAEFLESRTSVYFMWDFWRTGTVFADEYPNAVIRTSGAVGKLSVDEWNAELEAEKHDCYIEHPWLPSDIYVFDDSFSWVVVFTHEFDDCEPSDNVKRFCVMYKPFLEA